MTENIVFTPVPDLSDLAASATWSVRYREPSGYECLLSLESASGVDVLQKAQAAITRLNESGCKPLNNHRLISANEEPAKAEKVFCPIHQVEMRLYEKDGRSWHAHRLEDGTWCRGKNR